MCLLSQKALKSAEDYAKEMQQMEWPTHPPGRILHIVEQEESRCEIISLPLTYDDTEELLNVDHTLERSFLVWRQSTSRH